MPAQVSAYTIHGVNHDARARLGYSTVWAQYLPRMDLSPGRWFSSGSGSIDWLANLNRSVFEAHLAEILGGFEGALGLRDWAIMAPGKKLLLCHSFGCVLGYVLKLRHRWLDGIPMVGVGSPHTHPVLGRQIAWRGRSPTWGSRGTEPILIANYDDPITASQIARHVPFVPSSIAGPCPVFWIDPDDDGTFGEPHNQAHYFKSGVFSQVITELLC